MTPHQAYAVSLKEARLDQTALGQAWFDASDFALDKAPLIQPPFREVAYLDPKEVTARGYQVRLLHGQKLSIHVTPQVTEPMKLFIDLYEMPGEEEALLRHVVSADSLNRIAIEANDDLTYLVRVQPELLRGGRYTIDIQVNAALGFPVAGKNSHAIQSYFGAPRDGGRRLHKGVDIFARKGTPVIAISPGYVARVDETPIGGKVIWVRDAIRNQAYYYAHLDKHLVNARTRVEIGDTLGTVGTTGNAITTPPHLHFGIYATRRALDPLPFIHEISMNIPQVAADTSRLGDWIRVNSPVARLYSAPYSESDLLDELPRHTALRVIGGSQNWYFVQLPDGKDGFIAANLTEGADAPISNLQLVSGQPIKDRPSEFAVSIDSFGVDSKLPVFGRFGNFVGVTAPNGRAGWVAAMD
jgi:murein DD-endopeptidase MepM/ murein hydrolase activator NlpD